MPNIVSIGDVPSNQADAMLLAVSMACCSSDVPKDMEVAMLDAYDTLEQVVLGVTTDSQGYLYSEALRNYA